MFFFSLSTPNKAGLGGVTGSPSNTNPFRTKANGTAIHMGCDVGAMNAPHSESLSFARD